MMEFVRLGVLTPAVTICDKEEGVAGTINLNNEKTVYIDLDKALSQRLSAKYAILGGLAHEICHKYLFVNGLFLLELPSNEVAFRLLIGSGDSLYPGPVAIRSKY